MRGEVAGREAGGCGAAAAQAACTGEGPDSRLLGARARAERTWNMLYMVVTLEVLKLSGWLKACAHCRVEGRGAYAMRGDVRAGRRSLRRSRRAEEER